MRAYGRVMCACWLLAASPQAQTPLSPGTWRIPDAPAELRDSISRADLIIVSMQDTFLRDLTNALRHSGPAFAIPSCHVDVTGAIQRVGRHEGIAAGRTSDRLRNPTNAPRPWAATLVKAHAGRLARDVDGFVVDLGQVVGVLRPIAEQRMCASCHGPAATISPAVIAALKDRYPADQAIGFADGEIRGWYWVELPKQPR